MAWLRARAVSEGRIDAADLSLLRLVREPDEVGEIVAAAQTRQRRLRDRRGRARGPAQP